MNARIVAATDCGIIELETGGMSELAYIGHVKNGAIVLDEPISLPDGAVATIEAASVVSRIGGDADTSFADRFAEVLGKADTLPGDAAENHDHYLCRAAKR